LNTAIAMARAPVTNAVAAAMPKLLTMLAIETPPKICVIEKIGIPLTSSAITKNSRDSSDPRTICPLVSGVDRRMS
jgi:hypothetical protein